MPRSPFRAACFDMDGVLIQSRQVIEQAWTSVASDHGIRLTEAQIHAHVRGRPDDDTLNALFGEYTEAEGLAIKRQVDATEETAASPMLPGVAELLAVLRRARVPLALVTSSWPARIRFVLRLHGLEHAFDTIVSHEDVDRGKPDPGCYLLAAARLGVEPGDCLVFEDSQSGVKAAVQSGALCISIGDDAALLQHGAQALYPDFHALQSRFTSLPGHDIDPHDTAALLSLTEHSSLESRP